MNPPKRLPKSAVYFREDDNPWAVAETPREIMDLIHDSTGFLELTLATDDEWNGKSLFIRAEVVVAVSPPKETFDMEDSTFGFSD